MTFLSKLQVQWDEGRFLCVGLDTDPEKIPALGYSTESENMLMFNRQIVDAVADLVCAFKPNMAFYERFGTGGWLALHQTIKHINEVVPDVPVILDFKRGDIGNTNLGYVTEAFDLFDVDAVTVSPYLGQEAMQPFLDRKDKGIFVLCRTSNPGAGEFQDLTVKVHEKHYEPLYLVVADRVANKWNTSGNCGLVVGATYPQQLGFVRSKIGMHTDMPILIPGIGAQGGDLEKSVLTGRNSRGQGIIVNISREALYASSGKNYPAAARKVVQTRSDEIRAILKTA